MTRATRIVRDFRAEASRHAIRDHVRVAYAQPRIIQKKPYLVLGKRNLTRWGIGPRGGITVAVGARATAFGLVLASALVFHTLQSWLAARSVRGAALPHGAAAHGSQLKAVPLCEARARQA